MKTLENKKRYWYDKQIECANKIIETATRMYNAKNKDELSPLADEYLDAYIEQVHITNAFDLVLMAEYDKKSYEVAKKLRYI